MLVTDSCDERLIIVSQRREDMILDQMKHLQDYKGMGFDSTKILEFVQKAGSSSGAGYG